MRPVAERTSIRAATPMAASLGGLVCMLIPLAPRPTIGGVGAAVAIGLACTIIAVGAVYTLSGSATRKFNIGLPVLFFYTALLGTALYLARVITHAEFEEYEAALSRVLFLALAVAFTVIAVRHGPFTMLMWFTIGVIILSVLVAFIAATGTVFLEPVRPARTFGFTLPFFKTAGVPRSFGEQGVIVSLVAGFLLVYRDRVPRPVVVLGIVALLVILAAGQSRNMVLSVVVVAAAYFALTAFPRRLVALAAIVCSGLASFMIERILPTFAETQLGTAMVGEGILEDNVGARFELVRGAFDLLWSRPVEALAGWSHADWLELSPPSISTTIHNHFVALLVFNGVVAGALVLLGLFVLPLVGIVKRFADGDAADDRESLRYPVLVLVTGCGALSSLNFYEGFFSISLAMFIGIMWSLFVSRPNRKPQFSAA